MRGLVIWFSHRSPRKPTTRAPPARASGTKVEAPGPPCTAPMSASIGVRNQTKCWPCQNFSELRKATGVPTMAQP